MGNPKIPRQMLDRAALLTELRDKPQYVEMTLDRAAVKVGARTVDLAFCSEVPYERWWGVEILDCNPKSVRMDRLNNKAAVLVDHSSDKHVGVVESARIDRDRKGRAKARFGRSEYATEILQDIEDGIRTKISVGYVIHDLVLERKQEDLSTYRVTDWEPFEISIVSVPADDTVGVDRSADPNAGFFRSKENMNPTNHDDNDHASRRERELAAQQRFDQALEKVPEQDRADFTLHISDLAREHEISNAAVIRTFGTIERGYESWRVAGIRELVAMWPDTGDQVELRGARDRAILNQTAYTAFRKDLKAMLFQGQHPTPTGQLELDRIGPHHQLSYGAGAREVNLHTNLQSFKGPDAAHRAFACGQWFRGQVGDAAAARWCRENGIVATRVMTEGVFTAGGALVPDMISNEIISNVETFGVVRRFARNWPMTSATLAVPTNGEGLTVAAVGENTATPTSDLTVGQVLLSAKEFAGGTRASRALLEDTPIALGDFLIAEFARALARSEDQCGLTADGTSTYGGMRGIVHKMENDANHAGSTLVAVTAAHDTFAEIDVVDLTALMGRLPEYARAGAAWYLSGSAKDTILTRLAASGGGNTTESMKHGVGDSFLGYPVRLSPVLPSNSATDYSGDVMLLFGNLALATAFGDRRMMDAVIDMSRFIEFRQAYFQITERYDVVNHMNGSTATACGPIVGLLGGAS